MAAAGDLPVFKLAWGTTGSNPGEFDMLFGIDVKQHSGTEPVTRVYVSDTYNKRLQVFTPGGEFVQTLGEGSLNWPYGVAADLAGNVYVTDILSSRVIKFTAGSGDAALVGGVTPEVTFNMPFDVAVYENGADTFLFVADTYNNRIVKMTPDGALAASYTAADGKNFYRPMGVAVDSAGNVYTADTYNHRIVKINADGSSALFAGGARGSGNGQFNQPTGVAVDAAGHVFVADKYNNRIQKLGADGAFLAKWSSGDSPLSTPQSVAAEGEDGVYVADTGNNRVQVFEKNAAPSGVTISKADVNEGLPAGTLVGYLHAVDANLGETDPADDGSGAAFFTYSFVESLSGQTCDGNASFRISGNQLKTAAVFDYETQTSYAICVQAFDSGGLSVQVPLTIEVSDGLSAPEFTQDSYEFYLDEYVFQYPDGSTNTITFHVLPNSITEAGTVVSSISVADDDPGETVSFSIADSPYKAAFSLSSVETAAGVHTTNLVVADPTLLNYEQIPGGEGIIELVVTATDSYSMQESANVKIIVSDLNDPPMVTAANTVFTVRENATSTTPVGSVTISDEDLAGQVMVITDNSTSFMTLQDGKIQVGGPTPLDYEKTQSYDYQVMVKDVEEATNTQLSTHVFHVTINVEDVNEPPVLLDKYSRCYVNENAPAGTAVAPCYTDPDNDPLIYTITPDGDGSNGLFVVDGAGLLVVSDKVTTNPALLDYEALGTNKYYPMKVQVSDGVNPITSVKSIYVYVNNLNEYKPEITVPTDLAIDENAATRTYVGKLTVVDADGPKVDFDPLDFTGPFTIKDDGTIETLSWYNADQKVFINHELTPQYAFRVKVSDKGNPEMTDEETIIITIRDKPEPITLVANQVFNVLEHSEAGTLVGAVAWQDEDEYTTPSFLTSFSEGYDLFAIDGQSGVITVREGAVLDYEVKNSYTLSIAYTDNEGFSATGAVTVQLTNGNDPPVFNAPTPVSVVENSAAGTQAFAVTAADPNAGDAVTYSITGGTGVDAFAIDPNTGMLSVADSSKVDYEANLNHALTVIVKATDNGSPSRYATLSVDVPLSNVNEMPYARNTEFNVVEGTANNAVIGFLEGTDPEDGTAYIRYDLTGGTGINAFNFDETTGRITVKDTGELIPSINPVLTLVVKIYNEKPEQPEEESEDLTITLHVNPRADPAIQGFTKPAVILTGTTIPYAVTLENKSEGPSDPIELFIYLNPGISYNASSSCAKSGDAVVKCTLAALAGKSTHTFDMLLNVNLSLGDGATVTTNTQLVTNSNNDTSQLNNQKIDTYTVQKSEVFFYDFENPVLPSELSGLLNDNGTPVSFDLRQVTAPNGQKFLGKQTNSTVTGLNNGTVTYQRDNLTIHERVEVSFDLYIIQTWNGNGPDGDNLPDLIKFLVGGTPKPLLNASFSNFRHDGGMEYPQSYPSAYGEGVHPAATGADPDLHDSLGYTYIPGGDGVAKPIDTTYHMRFTLDHNDANLILWFIGENLQPPNDESWGIDNLKITLMGVGNIPCHVPMLRR